MSAIQLDGDDDGELDDAQIEAMLADLVGVAEPTEKEQLYAKLEDWGKG